MKQVAEGTAEVEYTDLLLRRSGAKWKQAIDVQRPYRWNLKRLQLGKVLDVGCGIGRNLNNLSSDSVGVDHNESSVAIARNSGRNAVTSKVFFENKIYEKDSFDSMLLAHVLEHMSSKDGKDIILQYLPYVRDKVVVICPQEKGFKTDATHVNFLRANDIAAILKDCGLEVEKAYSFPFPKAAGKVFTYNETVVVGRKAIN